MSTKAFKQACLVIGQQQEQIRHWRGEAHRFEGQARTAAAEVQSLQQKAQGDFNLITDLRAEIGRLTKATEAERERGYNDALSSVFNNVNGTVDAECDDIHQALAAIDKAMDNWAAQENRDLRAELEKWRTGELKPVSPVSLPVSDEDKELIK